MKSEPPGQQAASTGRLTPPACLANLPEARVMLRVGLLLAGGVLPLLTAEVAPNATITVDFDAVMRLTFERNADILVARERVNESQIALDSALQSCLPEMLRKDIFKKPAAEATVWRRRIELRKTESDALQDAASTYFDWLTALGGEEVARDLLTKEEKLLDLARKFAQNEPPAQVVVEAIETAVNGQRQYVLHTHQQSEAAAAKLAYLMGKNDSALTTTETLQPINRIDTSVASEVLVQQAQENGPGVRELQGLMVSLQRSIAEACRAQRRCARTGAPLVCGRLQMAQSQLQQAQLGLLRLQLQLRAGVEEAFTAIRSGREQLELASKAIDHARETYRLMEKRLPPNESPQQVMSNKTFDGVLNSIRQLAQAQANYLTVVSNYNKAQARLLIILGTYTRANCPAPTP